MLVFRSYLIQRPKDKSDPNPNVSTVLPHIWPLMLLVTLAKLIILTLTAGLLGPFIFLGLFILFMINYAALYTLCKEKSRVGSAVYKPSEDPENIHLLQSDDRSQQKLRIGEKEEEDDEEDEESFLFIAALCSVWLPCVVGDQSRKIYLVSGMTSIVSNVLLLAIAVALAACGLQEHVYPRPFLLFCFEKNATLLLQDGVKQCSLSQDDCFHHKNSNEMKYEDALTKLYNGVLAYQDVIAEIGNNIQSGEPRRDHNVLQSRLYDATAFLGEIKQIMEEFVTSTGTGQVQQRVRVCEENESLFLLCLLLGVLAAIALAVFSIYMLHKKAEYEVR